MNEQPAIVEHIGRDSVVAIVGALCVVACPVAAVTAVAVGVWVDRRPITRKRTTAAATLAVAAALLAIAITSALYAKGWGSIARWITDQPAAWPSWLAVLAMLPIELPVGAAVGVAGQAIHSPSCGSPPATSRSDGKSS